MLISVCSVDSGVSSVSSEPMFDLYGLAMAGWMNGKLQWEVFVV